MKKKGIIVLAHGSRAEKADSVLSSLVDKFSSEVDCEYVERAAMELTEPTLADKVEEMAGREVEKIIVLPLFLFPGIHVQEDIPAMMEKLEENYPQIEFKLGEIVGDDDKLVDILKDRLREEEEDK